MFKLYVVLSLTVALLSFGSVPVIDANSHHAAVSVKVDVLVGANSELHHNNNGHNNMEDNMAEEPIISSNLSQELDNAELDEASSLGVKSEQFEGRW